MIEAGQVANGHAAAGVFDAYAERQADNTLRRQRADLAVFADFLCSAGIPECPSADDLLTTPGAWRGVSWGMVEAFRNWQVAQGYAVGSVNVRLSTVKTYARLATKAGTLSTTDLALIRAVEGYSRKEGKRVDERREVTRTGAKKAESVTLTKEQADALKGSARYPTGAARCCDHGVVAGSRSTCGRTGWAGCLSRQPEGSNHAVLPSEGGQDPDAQTDG